MKSADFWIWLFVPCLAAVSAGAQSWTPKPWLDDLAQARQAFEAKYANLEWLANDRQVSLASLFNTAAASLQRASSDVEARAVFDRLARGVADAHVVIDWPNPHGAAAASAAIAPTPADGAAKFCANLGFDATQMRAGLAQYLRGYSSVGSDGIFPAGVVNAGAERVGVLRIGLFEAEAYPALCTKAFEALKPIADPCTDACQDKISDWIYAQMTVELEAQLGAVKAAGATTLLVDLTANPGGTEWTWAAVRTMSAKTLLSDRRGFVRGEHWSKKWANTADQLRAAATKAAPDDRTRLLEWAAKSDAAHKVAETPCRPGDGCEWTPIADYGTGLVGQARSDEFAGKPWGRLVFDAAQFPYHDGVWSGPTLVLVDERTGSAAEAFAAILQDNQAAVIIGSRTSGSGGGFTDGGTPTVLTNSGGIVRMPDFVSFRADGSNRVSGVIPDFLVGMRVTDGSRFRIKLIMEQLPQAINRAKFLARPHPVEHGSTQ